MLVALCAGIAGAVLVASPALAIHAADLTTRDAFLSPESPKAGDSVTFRAWIHNDGHLAAANFKVEFFVDGGSIGKKDVLVLADNASDNVSSSGWTATAGSHQIRVYVDADATVAESDENNNRTETFAVVSPDLVVDDIVVAPPVPSAGTAANFTATVRNGGTASAGAFRVEFKVGALSIGKADVSSLAAGASVNVTSPNWNAVAGAHTIHAVADSDLQVAESAEDNNNRSEPFVVAGPPAPDLVVLALSRTPASPVPGDTTTFTATVLNQGSLPTGAFKVEFVLDSSSLGLADAPGLSAGAQVNVTSPGWTATLGAHTLRGKADAQAQVAEGDEDNNERTDSFIVNPAPTADLVVAGIAPSPAAPADGDNVTFAAEVKNQGNLAAGPFNVSFSVDGAGIGTVSVAALDAGASTTLASPVWRAATGSHVVSAEADPDEAVDEGDEGNNQRTTTLVVGVPSRPDLLVLELSASPATPTEGREASFTAVVKNGGTAPAGPFQVEFLVGEASLGKQGVDGLEAGAEAAVASAAWTGVAGNHAVRAVADADAEIVEASEDNNDRTITLAVKPAKTATPGFEPALLGLVVVALRRRHASR